MQNLKLNKLAENRLNEKEMENITGGYISITVRNDKGEVVYDCGCGCYYEGKPGGSSTSDNMNANIAGSLHSPIQ
jgi:natural product precursor